MALGELQTSEMLTKTSATDASSSTLSRPTAQTSIINQQTARITPLTPAIVNGGTSHNNQPASLVIMATTATTTKTEAPPPEKTTTETATNNDNHQNHHHYHQRSSTKLTKQTDSNTAFLRAARAGDLEKLIVFLESGEVIDINASNANGLNALHLAAKDGHVTIVRELLKRGASVDNTTKKGNSALHIASLAGQKEVIKILIQHGADVNLQSQNGFTPLYMAAQENHDTSVRYLLSKGGNQALATEDGFTPLAVAMQQGHDRVVAVLLESDSRGKVRLPALHIAAKKDDVKAATLLLENEHNPDAASKSGFTPLHIAAHYGNTDIANLLLDKGADVNYAAKHNITPLHVACKWGKTLMVNLLIEKGAKIDSTTRDGLTPLHCAARSGHEQVIDILLENHAQILSKTKNGLAPLHMAAQGEHVDAARILLYHKAPVDEVTVDYLTALHVAAHCGHVKVAKLLLDRNADPNSRALNGFTPLHIACKKNRIKIVELLLKHGASKSATTENGLTPLHVASFMGCMNIVIYLLQHDASPDIPTVRGETPLHLAARANQTDIIRILLRNGAQVDAKAREEQTPLHVASRLGNVDIVMLLLQHGANIDSVTKYLYTPLHIAAKEGQDEVAAILIDNNATLDAATKKGFTPLHLAGKYGNLTVAELLLRKGAAVDAQGKNGVTPLHVASHYDHQNVALLLLEKGASPHASAKNGHTPLHIAAKKNQMDIATTLIEYGALADAESKSGFTPIHLSAQEGHTEMSALLLAHKADPDRAAKNGLTPLHLCAQEDKVNVAEVLIRNDARIDATTKAGFTPLHVAAHFGQINMVKYLLENDAPIEKSTNIGYTPLHQAAQQGHTLIINLLLKHKANPNALTNNGQTALNIANKLGYVTVVECLKIVTETTSTVTGTVMEEKYRVIAPESMHETFMSDSEDEGGEDPITSDQQQYKYMTVDDIKGLDDTIKLDPTNDDGKMEKVVSHEYLATYYQGENQHQHQHQHQHLAPAPMIKNKGENGIIANGVGFDSKDGTDIGNINRMINDGGGGGVGLFGPPVTKLMDNIDVIRHPIHVGFLVSFLVDARGGAMRGCRHSGVRVIVPPKSAAQPTRITCRYVKPNRIPNPPPLMEGEALVSRILELAPVAAKFLGPVILEIPHFASLRQKEREIIILRSDNGDTWREHTLYDSEEAIQDVLNDSFEAGELSQLEDLHTNRIIRIVTHDFPHYLAVVSRIRQEVHVIGPDGGTVSSAAVPQVQAVFPANALTKKIRVGLQAQPIDLNSTATLLGRGVAVSPVVTVEPRRRKFHKAITLSMPAPQAHTQGMINQYSGNAPTLRLLCSITGGQNRAVWEDVTGSTPLTFVKDCVSFTTTVSARFWLMDCRNISEACKMATELYTHMAYVPFMVKFVVFAKRTADANEAKLSVFCMTDDKEDKTLEQQEQFTEVAKSRDVEVLEGRTIYLEFAGNLVPIMKSGEQFQMEFHAFKENRLTFHVRIKDDDGLGRISFMNKPKVAKGEPPLMAICSLNISLPEKVVDDEQISEYGNDGDVLKRHDILLKARAFYNQPSDDEIHKADIRLSDICNLLADDWIRLANELDVPNDDIELIKNEYTENSHRAMVMLRLWLRVTGKQATGNLLEQALHRINRSDIVKKCIFNLELVTDETEKAAAKLQLDQSGFDSLQDELMLGSRKDIQSELTIPLQAAWYQNGGGGTTGLIPPTAEPEKADLSLNQSNSGNDSANNDIDNEVSLTTATVTTAMDDTSAKNSIFHNNVAETAAALVKDIEESVTTATNYSIENDRAANFDHKTISIDRSNACESISDHVKDEESTNIQNVLDEFERNLQKDDGNGDDDDDNNDDNFNHHDITMEINRSQIKHHQQPLDRMHEVSSKIPILQAKTTTTTTIHTSSTPIKVKTIKKHSKANRDILKQNVGQQRPAVGDIEWHLPQNDHKLSSSDDPHDNQQERKGGQCDDNDGDDDHNPHQPLRHNVKITELATFNLNDDDDDDDDNDDDDHQPRVNRLFGPVLIISPSDDYSGDIDEVLLVQTSGSYTDADVETVEPIEMLPTDEDDDDDDDDDDIAGRDDRKHRIVNSDSDNSDNDGDVLYHQTRHSVLSSGGNQSSTVSGNGDNNADDSGRASGDLVGSLMTGEKILICSSSGSDVALHEAGAELSDDESETDIYQSNEKPSIFLLSTQNANDSKSNNDEESANNEHMTMITTSTTPIEETEDKIYKLDNAGANDHQPQQQQQQQQQLRFSNQSSNSNIDPTTGAESIHKIVDRFMHEERKQL